MLAPSLQASRACAVQETQAFQDREISELRQGDYDDAIAMRNREGHVSKYIWASLRARRPHMQCICFIHVWLIGIVKDRFCNLVTDTSTALQFLLQQGLIFATDLTTFPPACSHSVLSH